MSFDLVVQLIGLIALFISLSVFQINDRKKMLALGIISAVLYAMHFSLLGATTGAAMNLIGAVRSYIFFTVQPDRRHLWVLFGFSGITVLGALLTWQGPLSLLPLLGSLASGIAYWQRKPKLIRRWALVSNPLWFTYNAVSGSYPGMVVEIIMLISNCIGQYRFDYRHDMHHKTRLARVA